LDKYTSAMSVAASGIAPTATSSSSLPQIYLPSEEIDRRLEENERLLEEWKILFSKVILTVVVHMFLLVISVM
jgi:hypothetical protein